MLIGASHLAAYISRKIRHASTLYGYTEEDQENLCSVIHFCNAKDQPHLTYLSGVDYCSLTKITDYNEHEKSWPDNHNSLHQPQHHNNNKKLKNVNT